MTGPAVPEVRIRHCAACGLHPWQAVQVKSAGAVVFWCRAGHSWAEPAPDPGPA